MTNDPQASPGEAYLPLGHPRTAELERQAHEAWQALERLEADLGRPARSAALTLCQYPPHRDVHEAVDVVRRHYAGEHLWSDVTTYGDRGQRRACTFPGCRAEHVEARLATPCAPSVDELDATEGARQRAYLGAPIVDAHCIDLRSLEPQHVVLTGPDGEVLLEGPTVGEVMAAAARRIIELSDQLADRDGRLAAAQAGHDELEAALDLERRGHAETLDASYRRIGRSVERDDRVRELAERWVTTGSAPEVDAGRQVLEALGDD
jgi:hypothetical protein